MSVSSPHYKGVIKKANKLIASASKFLGNGEGLIIPILFSEDIAEIDMTISEMDQFVGKLELYIRGLVKGSDRLPIYTEIRNQMIDVRNQLNEFLK